MLRVFKPRYCFGRVCRQWLRRNGIIPTVGRRTRCWRGNYGLDDDAGHLVYRWLYCIARNAHDVFVEYGNVGTKFSCIASEGFGWMNASFEVGMNYLSPQQLADLKALKPPSEK